ncbi:MAG: SMC-Scp complex subunit ScpB [Promethearchaeota archaeon]
MNEKNIEEKSEVTEEFQEEKNESEEEEVKDENNSDNKIEEEILADLNDFDDNTQTEADEKNEISDQEPEISQNDDITEEEDFGEETTQEDLIEEEVNEEEKDSEEIDEQSHKKNVLEGALFVAGRPVSLEELNIKTEIRKSELKDLLEELMMDYLMRPTALEIVQIQDKYSLQIKPEYTPKVKKFASGGLIPNKHLKTLTIIALKQPLLKSTLVKIRGSGAYEHVKFLLDRGFIVAKKKGRSFELTTSDQFADTFGLSRDINILKKQMIMQLGINDQKKPAKKENQNSPQDDVEEIEEKNE